MPRLFGKVTYQRHGPFLIGMVLALLICPLLLYYVPDLAPGISVVVFFLAYLILMAIRIPHLDGEHFRKTGQNDDEPAPVILGVTLLTVASSVILLFNAVNAKNDASVIEVCLAFASVVLGWFTIHTMFALHYAHLYWRPEVQELDDEGKRGGLDFPETSQPGVYDFLYFAFVIGMTAQTSDVGITSTDMRRINLLHSIVSFFFNTVLVAASVNAAVALGG
ncbi:DUF1345 domain-containing protein [Neorhizobium lilium]|uniref:DUF1345 domain-containing protein n=1 Tax=Neorhizobium lilium TaxID=2503024 RepID=A0A3S4UPT0_9HYPH|nr:DUF1345 domain-containing protein [Neorhizobium lilium]RWX78335.1 DUF1345 domain-containing protein [Neorhizobium lilium]